jgi:hypothetical protein
LSAGAAFADDAEPAVLASRQLRSMAGKPLEQP